MKRILPEKKTVLLSIRNQNWKIVKAETEKINIYLTNIPKNTTELNDLIYAGAKLVCGKIGVPLKGHGWEIKLFVWVSVDINVCRLFNVKSISI